MTIPVSCVNSRSGRSGPVRDSVRTELVASMGNEINIYRAEDAEKVTTLKGHKGGIYALDFHPSGTQISASGFDGIVRIYELKSNSLLKAFVPVPIAAASASAR